MQTDFLLAQSQILLRNKQVREVLKNVSILKIIYIEFKDINAYLALCEKTGTTPKDCENIANICKVKRKYQDALNWVEKGLKLEKKERWGNESGFGLTELQQANQLFV